jgi:hypothetical protein
MFLNASHTQVEADEQLEITVQPRFPAEPLLMSFRPPGNRLVQIHFE